jgi:putative CocE/NonD family hydrolase
MKVLQDIAVPTRDGEILATDVYLPETGGGPWPVVMERTPYNKCAPSRSEVTLAGDKISRLEMAQAFVSQGFACVFQDCRGRYSSSGTFTKYINEANDGYDTCQWLVEQDWCNGKIGTMGLSYAAHTQMAMACLNPPGLASMVLDSGGFSNAYQCGIRQGGAFELKQVTWAYRQALVSPKAQQDPIIKNALEQEDIRQWFAYLPWKSGQSPLRYLPEYEEYLLEQWREGSFSDFWKQSGIYALDGYHNIPDIPIMLMSSWYDVYVKSTLENYQVLSEKNHSQTALIMGPWLHGDRNTTHCGDVEFGPAASFDGNIAPSWLNYRVQWFKRWLTENNSAEFDNVQVFQMGGGSGEQTELKRINHGGHWLRSDRWPLPNSEAQSWYLHRNGKLSRQAPTSADTLSYLADPNHPVPTIGGALTSGKPVFEGGAFDQREDARFYGAKGNHLPLAARADILVFETEPLEQDMIVSGKISAKLFIESEAPDTDFTIKLVDVYPPSVDYPQGFAMNISDGIFRCRYHSSWEHPELLQQGVVYEIEVEAFASQNCFAKGHKLRLDIASSNFPKFDVNPNSGEPEGEANLKQVAKNTIHCSAHYPSALSLEVLAN